MTIIVNKQVWMQCFSKEVPCEEEILNDIQKLQSRLQILNTKNSPETKRTHSQLKNSLKRRQKMLAAVKDGQPWAWMLYPSHSEYSKTTEFN